MADLSVIIGADISAYQAAMAAAGQTAKQTSQQIIEALNQAKSSITGLGTGAQSASMQFIQMRSGLSAMRDGALAFAVGGQRADMMLMAMGHHITSLVNETGSVSGAFKALGSSLMGAGGVILGLTLAYELYEKLTKSSKDAAVAQTDMQKSIEKNSDSASTELSHLMILYQATQNTTLSIKERTTAVMALQKEYPAYFGNMSKEAILTGQAAGAYDRLTQSIINSAVTKAGQDDLAAQIKPLIQLNATLKAQQIEIEESYSRIKAKAKPDTTQNWAQPGYRQVNPNSVTTHPGVPNSLGVIDEAGDLHTLDDYKKAITDKIKANAQAIQELLTQYGVASLLNKDEVIPKRIPESKTQLELLEKQLGELQSKEDDLIAKGHTPDFWNTTALERQIAGLETEIARIKELNSAMDQMPKDIKTPETGLKKQSDITGKDGKPNFGDMPTISEMQSTIKAYAQLSNQISASRVEQDKFNAEVKAGNQQLKDLESVMGEGLNKALQSAISGTQNFFTAMGKFLVELVEQLIAAVIEALILATILSVVSGGTTSVLGEISGGGLSSFGKSANQGAGIISGFSSLGTHASGGIFTQAHAGIFGEAGPEAIVTPQHLQDFAGASGNGGDMTVKHVLSGADLQLWITRSSKSKSRTS